VSRIRAERKKIQRTEERRKKADVSRIRTERERIQRTGNRWEKTGFSVSKNAGKGLAHPEQGPREKNFRYLKVGTLPFIASATEALNARQTNAGSKAFRGETRDIVVSTYSARAAASGEGPGHKIISL
jgi:hypothetical protein